MSRERTGEWSVPRRVIFRFLFLYWMLYSRLGTNALGDILPWDTEKITDAIAWPIDRPALWLGTHVFHLHGVAATFHPTGSGDTALAYVQVFELLVVSFFGTVLWSLLDRRTEYRTLDAWLRLLVSLTVAVALLGYGFVKIWPSQFHRPTLRQLTEAYGDSSPMALLWAFMGGSRWYAMFGGFAEAVPGILLFFRRTRTLGALLAATVLLNIVALNFCYDVPVKLYSIHLLLMCIFLAAPDLPALVRLFLLRSQAQLRSDHVPAAERRWIRRAGYAMLGLVLASSLYTVGVSRYVPYPQRQTGAPLYGLWRVTRAASTIPGIPWEDISVEDTSKMLIKLVDGGAFRLDTKVDASQHTFALTSKQSGNGLLHYTPDPTNPRHVTLTGQFNKGEVRFELERRDPETFVLETRGFHWVSEYPFNR